MYHNTNLQLETKIITNMINVRNFHCRIIEHSLCIVGKTISETGLSYARFSNNKDGSMPEIIRREIIK